MAGTDNGTGNFKPEPAKAPLVPLETDRHHGTGTGTFKSARFGAESAPGTFCQIGTCNGTRMGGGFTPAAGVTILFVFPYFLVFPK